MQVITDIVKSVGRSAIDVYNEYKYVIDYIYDYVIEKYPKKYSFVNKNQRYDLRLVIIEIIYLLKTGISYTNYRRPNNAKTLNAHVMFFRKTRYFKMCTICMIAKYLEIKTATKLKYQSIDTSYIMNRNGKENIGRNRRMSYCGSYA